MQNLIALRTLMGLLIVGFVVGSPIIEATHGKALFRDDFEGDTLGKAPSHFEIYEHPHNSASLKLEVVADPEGESGKVMHQFSYGYYVPIAPERDDWTDWVWEWDWMWSQNGFPGTAFRLTDDEYYHISPRNDNQNVGFWYWNGNWNQKGPLVQYDFGLNTWNRFQVTAKGNQFILKIKRRDEKTPFAEIDPLLEVEDDTLNKGPMSVGGSDNQDTWVDNFVVGETEADLALAVDSAGKLATAWGAIKRDLGVRY